MSEKDALRVRRYWWLLAMWTFAVLATLGDIALGTEPNTYGLIGAAVGVTLAVVIIKGHERWVA